MSAPRLSDRRPTTALTDFMSQYDDRRLPLRRPQCAHHGAQLPCSLGGVAAVKQARACIAIEHPAVNGTAIALG